MSVRFCGDLFHRLLEERFGGIQNQLAQAAGVGRTVVSRAAAGEPISRANFARLREALGLPDDALVDESDGQPPSWSRGGTALSGTAPPPPPLLIGRESDLRELERRIVAGLPADGDQAVQVIVPIRGLPGVGKTALVGGLCARRSATRTFRCVLHAAVGNVPRHRLGERLLRILRSWGAALDHPGARNADGVEVAAAQLRRALADRRTLIVLDDVWHRDAATRLMVGGRESATLITTRDHDLARQLTPGCGELFTLDCLRAGDARTLLRRFAKHAVERHPAECDALLERLGGLPLAIQIAGRDLLAAAEREESIPEAIRAVCDLGALLERDVPADMAAVVGDSSPTVAALLSRSVKRLPPADQGRFALLGRIPSEPASFALFPSGPCISCH